MPKNITVAKWPGHVRYGKVAGEANEHFLSSDLCYELNLKPPLSYKGQAGPLIFEFGTFNKSTFLAPNDFHATLDTFLAIPHQGCRYAVEIRNPEYPTPDHLDLHRLHDVAHVFNAWTRIPSLDDQTSLPNTYPTNFTVVRALFRKVRNYEDAVKTFKRYRKVQEPNEGLPTADSPLGPAGMSRSPRHNLV